MPWLAKRLSIGRIKVFPLYKSSTIPLIYPADIKGLLHKKGAAKRPRLNQNRILLLYLLLSLISAGAPHNGVGPLSAGAPHDGVTPYG